MYEGETRHKTYTFLLFSITIRHTSANTNQLVQGLR